MSAETINDMASVVETVFRAMLLLYVLHSVYVGAYRRPFRLLWLTAMLAAATGLVVAVVGYLLPWGQIDFWIKRAILSAGENTPYVGDWLKGWLWSEPSLFSPNLAVFSGALKRLGWAAGALSALLVLHVLLFIKADARRRRAGASAGLPFHAYFTINGVLFFLMLAFPLVCAAGVFLTSASVGAVPPFLTHVVSATIAALNWINMSLLAFVLPFDESLSRILMYCAVIGVWFLAPVLDRRCAPAPLRGWAAAFYFIFLANFGVLSLIGVTLAAGGSAPGAFAAILLYFAFFFIVLPIGRPAR